MIVMVVKDKDFKQVLDNLEVVIHDVGRDCKLKVKWKFPFMK